MQLTQACGNICGYCWIHAGEEENVEGGSSLVMGDEKLLGGGCNDSQCHAACVQKRPAEGAHGFCLTIENPNDSCICRYPC